MVFSRVKSYAVARTLEIIPGVYQLTTGDANIVVIIKEEPTLIDTGFPSSTKGIVGEDKN